MRRCVAVIVLGWVALTTVTLMSRSAAPLPLGSSQVLVCGADVPTMNAELVGRIPDA